MENKEIIVTDFTFLLLDFYLWTSLKNMEYQENISLSRTEAS